MLSGTQVPSPLELSDSSESEATTKSRFKACWMRLTSCGNPRPSLLGTLNVSRKNMDLNIWFLKMTPITLLRVIPTLTLYSDKVPDVTSGSIYGMYIILSDLLSGILLWHSIWHSVWHSLWHGFGSRHGTLHPELAIGFGSSRGPLHPEDPFMLTVPTSWQKKEAEEEVEDEEEGVAPLLKSRV